MSFGQQFQLNSRRTETAWAGQRRGNIIREVSNLLPEEIDLLVYA